MGANNNPELEKRQEKFQHMFRNNYLLKEDKNHQIFGNIKLFINVNTKQIQIMVKEIMFSNQSQMSKLIAGLQSRIIDTQSNLLNIYSIEIRHQDIFCGEINQLKIYVEYIQKSLKTQIRNRKSKNFREEQLWKMLRSLTNALRYLHSRGTFHGQISFSNVLIDQEFHVKLVDRIIMKEANWQVGFLQQSVKMIQNKDVLFSPQLLKCLQHNRMQMVNYDPFKADIFALGMIMLECSSLEKVQNFYDYNKFEVRNLEISRVLYCLRKVYSWELINIIQKMLDEDDFYRPTAQIVYNSIQSKFQNLSQSLNSSFANSTVQY